MSSARMLPNPHSLPFVEALYDDYRQNRASVPAEWHAYFDELAAADRADARPRPAPSFAPTSIFNPRPANGRNGQAVPRPGDAAQMQHRVDMLIRNFRVRGHVAAQIDPLGRPRPHVPEIEPSFYGFSDADMDRPFSTDGLAGARVRTLREIIGRMFNTYCQSIGAQFMHIDDLSVRAWLQARMEDNENRVKLSRTEQFRILTRLTEAVFFEEFIQKKFLGAKSFSLEGAESLIPLLDLVIDKAGEQGVEDLVIGMAHRGRLNVLANVMGKSPRLIFREFADVDAAHYHGSGDVKYHLGYHSSTVTASGRALHLALAFNPSHLEFVNPVALGRVRARQDRVGDLQRERGLCVLVHGDAAFIGEGIVQETLNLSELPGYRIGGTLHVIVNNQLGFTTTPAEGRSTVYATDVAKMLQSPIFHVNGEDPDAVATVVRLALDFRQKFQRDVVIDMYCYRRRGHNEQDEPSFTQPLMYKAIAARKPIRESYVEHLRSLGDITREAADEIAERLRENLEHHLAGARNGDGPPVATEPTGRSPMAAIWARYRGGRDADVPDVETGVPRASLAKLLEQQATLPAGFQPHPKIARLLEERRQMAHGEKRLDWGAAEALAFGSLAVSGTRVRLTGQDSGRGTFSHRHAILYDYETGRPYLPLQHLAPDQAPVEIYNSPLSEAAVLGYEYGYSAAAPDVLVLWEAQFGDFVNCAQVIIDQFITSAEDKWHRLSGLVLLLPHGFEGQGPEHSSGRLERFLELAAEDNIQVVVPSTPASYFHALRRQALRPWRKPLVVFTPKSLLRQRDSTLDELARGGFQRVIPDLLLAAEPAAGGAAPRAKSRRAAAGRKAAAAGRRAAGQSKIRRIVLCCGKLYHELAAGRAEQQRADVAIVRLEQLYPLREADLQAALAAYPDGTPVVWVQEEPANMGAWRYLQSQFGATVLERFPFSGVCRPASASPATGSPGSHRIEQRQLIEQALTGS